MKLLRLKETCTQYQVIRNRYGDIVLTPSQTIKCLYRNISNLTRNVNFREEVEIQGIFWFDPAATVKQGDVIGYLGQLYRLEDVTIAKTLLRRDNIHFIKCNASLYRAIS